MCAPSGRVRGPDRSRSRALHGVPPEALIRVAGATISRGPSRRRAAETAGGHPKADREDGAQTSRDAPTTIGEARLQLRQDQAFFHAGAAPAGIVCVGLGPSMRSGPEPARCANRAESRLVAPSHECRCWRPARGVEPPCASFPRRLAAPRTGCGSRPRHRGWRGFASGISRVAEQRMTPEPPRKKSSSMADSVRSQHLGRTARTGSPPCGLRGARKCLCWARTRASASA